jgi:hypothetical protein
MCAQEVLAAAARLLLLEVAAGLAGVGQTRSAVVLLVLRQA